MENYAKLQQAVEDMKKDLELCLEKGNKSAGQRVRVKCRDIKDLAQEIRKVTQSKTTKS